MYLQSTVDKKRIICEGSKTTFVRLGRNRGSQDETEVFQWQLSHWSEYKEAKTFREC